MVGPGYFETVGIPIVEGRAFTPRDDTSATPVVIVNEVLARRLWPNGNAVGRRFRVDTERKEVEVVGVARTAKYFFVTEEGRPFLYLPHAQRYSSLMTLHLHTDTDPAALAAPARQAVLALDREMPVYDVRTMSAHLNGGIAFFFLRLAATLAAAVGLLGLVQTVVGLYGVISYAVSQRTRDIGIRMALGARSADVLRSVVGQGAVLTGAGVLIGLAAAYAVSRAVGALLYGVSGTDAPTYLAAALVLSLCALTASAIPAWRAARVEPSRALRSE